jgi:predicted CxxxxCH...CXXCH cytochrome family protein
VLAVLVVAGCQGGHHPDGFAAGAMHGQALKDQTEDCRACHGAELTGGEAVGCDGCHSGATPEAWRSNCTFCHGGVINDTGAPPRNLDGTDQVGPFPVHTIHVTGSGFAVPFDCKQCHTKAIDVLSPGHVFDETPGEAENDFGDGLSPQTSFSLPDRTCSNNYCHGSGRGDDGEIAALAGSLACDSCHPVAVSGAAGWGRMSGLHNLHLGLPDVTCGECHQATTTDGVSIASLDLHVDGRRDVSFGGAATGVGFAADTQTCNGACHGYTHTGQGWGSFGGGFHPDGFAAGSVHGTEMELQRSDCRGCHGADLTGGQGPGCDGCHSGATPDAWRTDCTFCHGGGLTDTGAPPVDLGSTNTSAAQSFVAHTKHVTQGVAAASDCVQCHRKPTDVMSAGHAFDATPEAAEISMANGLSPAGSYNGNGTCANVYCHGNGRTNGTYTDGLGPLSCNGCHPTNGLAGKHEKHINDENMTCNECHLQVAGSSTTIIAPALHVDGVKQMQMEVTTIVWDPATRRCTGPCHGENHNDAW